MFQRLWGPASFSPGLNIYFLQKRLFRIKTAITLVFELGKNCVIYKKLSTRKFTSDFNHRRPFAQKIEFQNSKGKYERKKILDFANKNEKILYF
jgi:hypothetical protein